MKRDKAPLFLGIDTGGTFTDSVLFDPTARSVVARSKAPTTHGNLIEGILNSIAGLAVRDPRAVGMVGLSTTLATNAVVEKKNRPVGLIIVGYDRDLTVPIPAVRIKRVAGGHTVRGQEAHPLDERAVREFVASADGSVEAYACASYFSVRNPRHEDRVEAIIKKATKRPIVLGHRLSMDLDAEVRATTAALNAGLIPLVAELLDAVRDALGHISIVAPLMVVRGDGSLMSEATARARPIETILSGPAASVVGAKTLAPKTDGADTVVIDVGGTTTDIAALAGGRPRLSARGARVGDYRTFVSAVDIQTVGLGGDSFIDYSDGNDLCVGPNRVLPVGRLAERYPEIVPMIEKMEQIPRKGGWGLPTDFYAAASPGAPEGLGEEEGRLLERIVQRPLCMADQTDVRQRFSVERALDRLMGMGVVVRAGLTPTDVFNAEGTCRVGDPEASMRACRAAARWTKTGEQAFRNLIFSVVERRLFYLIMGASLGVEMGRDAADFGILKVPVDAWLRDGGDGRGVRLEVSLSGAVVGVGAPVGLFVEPIARRLGARCIVPPDAAVASAVGAVSGVVEASREAVIRAFGDGRYVLFTPDERKDFTKLSEARAVAMELLTGLVREEIETGSTVESRVTGDWEEHWGGDGENKILIEARLVVRAVGRHAAVAD